MDQLLNLEPWWRFGAALLIGALIGLEREFVQQRSGEPEFGGIRTFALMALLGAIAAFFAEQYGLVLFVASYLGLILLIWASYRGEMDRGEEEGITTEVVGLIVPFLGAMMVWGFAELAASLAVVTALILALKPSLHALARKMSVGDLRATLEFALITAVVLPLLPNRGIGPFNVFNPFEIWLLVVLVSGISFTGYILMKALGAQRGIGLTGALGGLVSSTAVTLSFSGRSKESPALAPAFAIAIVLASCVMFPRVLIEALALNAPLAGVLLLPLSAMLCAGLVGVAVLWRRRGREGGSEEKVVELANPLRLTTAIGFGLVFAVVLLVIKAASVFFGSAGVYVASALTGLTDVDAITLSVSDLAAKGQIPSQVAAVSVMMAVMVNTTVKAAIAAVLGTVELRRAVLRVFGFVLFVGIAASVAMALLIR